MLYYCFVLQNDDTASPFCLGYSAISGQILMEEISFGFAKN